MDLDHKIVCKLFDFTKSTFYNWKKEQRAIIRLIEKYFTDEDLEEFLEFGKIEKFDELENISFLKNKSYDFFVKLKGKLPPETLHILLDFLSNADNAKIEMLAQYIFSLDNKYFKVQSINQEDLKKLKINPTHKHSWPEPISIKLLILNQFQELDSFIFDFFCSNIQYILKQEKLRFEKMKDSINKKIHEED